MTEDEKAQVLEWCAMMRNGANPDEEIKHALMALVSTLFIAYDCDRDYVLRWGREVLPEAFELLVNNAKMEFKTPKKTGQPRRTGPSLQAATMRFTRPS